MGENGLSASDVALLSGNNNGGFGGENGWGGLIWLCVGRIARQSASGCIEHLGKFVKEFQPLDWQ